MYEQLRFEIRDGVVEIVNRYPSNMGAPGRQREKKHKKTPEEVERQNQRQREKTVQRLIAANFREGDFHLVLKYREAPATYEEAKKDLQRLLAAMRRRFKKAGYMFKYIGVTERGKRKAVLHHHLIIENIQAPELNTIQTVQELWEGHCAWHDLYEDGDYEDLAAYIVKKETKEENTGCTYTRSRNLRIPKVKRSMRRRKTWPEEPKPRKGWYIVKSSIENSINAFTGLPYQRYVMKKTRSKEELAAARADRERTGSRIRNRGKPCTRSISTLPPVAAYGQNTGNTDTYSNTSRQKARPRRVRDLVGKTRRRYTG